MFVFKTSSILRLCSKGRESSQKGCLTSASLSVGGCMGCPGASTFGTASP